MLKTRLLHPGILAALGEAGHGAQVLSADGNYPLLTRSSGAARRVYLNLAPGIVTVTDVLRILVDAIPIEALFTSCLTRLMIRSKNTLTENRKGYV